MRAAARVALAEPIVRLLARGAAPGLDRQIAGMLKMYALMKFKGMETMTIDEARAYSEGDLSPLEPLPIEMASIVDTTEAGVPARTYVPRNAGGNTLVWFHGGGGAIGSIQGADAVVRYMADRTKCTVVSVGYRLGPEAKHPAAIEDAIAAFQAVAARVDGKVAAGGDSFGGFLSAHIAHDAQVRNVRRPDVQLLVYPICDLTLASPSIDRLATGYVLNKPLIQWFQRQYHKPGDDLRGASPTYWPVLAGATPMIMVTAGFDPLVDEGLAFAAAYQKAGNQVRIHHEPGLIHGFLNVSGGIRAAHRATDRFCDSLVEMFGPSR